MARGWCSCCGTTRYPKKIHDNSEGYAEHAAIVSTSYDTDTGGKLEAVVLCFDCACSNPEIAKQDGCPGCVAAVKALTERGR